MSSLSASALSGYLGERNPLEQNHLQDLNKDANALRSTVNQSNKSLQRLDRVLLVAGLVTLAVIGIGIGVVGGSTGLIVALTAVFAGSTTLLIGGHYSRAPYALADKAFQIHRNDVLTTPEFHTFLRDKNLKPRLHTIGRVLKVYAEFKKQNKSEVGEGLSSPLDQKINGLRYDENVTNDPSMADYVRLGFVH
jgi:hypothetical protein